MSDDYSDFTKLVLARMETNPDEFGANNRWDTLVRGLEEYARGDMDGHYVKTLWPLEHQEIEVLMTKYRKMYLDRLHKDMLKNIVSGNDLPDPSRGIKFSNTPIQGSALRGAVPLSTTGIQAQTIGPVDTSVYDANRYSFSADVSSSSNIQLGNTTLTENDLKKLKKVLVAPSDHAIAQKMGMTVQEYIKRRDAA